MMRFKFTVRGAARDGQTWSVEGHVSEESAGNFPRAVDNAMRQAFLQLTRGKAVYGQPGVGCNGPYTITHLSLDVVEAQADAPAAA
jgi:hypothetical protein